MPRAALIAAAALAFWAGAAQAKPESNHRTARGPAAEDRSSTRTALVGDRRLDAPSGSRAARSIERRRAGLFDPRAAPSVSRGPLTPSAPSRANATRLVVLKIAGSGSTWFWQLLSAVEGVKIMGELYTSGSPDRKPRRRERGMASSLQCGALARVCGFTVSPKNSPGVDWARVGAAADVVAVWDRTNVAKMAVGIARKAMLKPMVGACPKDSKGKGKGRGIGTNLRNGSGCAASVYGSNATLPLEIFETRVAQLLGRRAAFMKDCAAATAAAPRAVTLTYEGLQRDASSELGRLFDALGRRDLLEASSSSRGPTVIKKTPEELRGAVANFDELRTYLATLGLGAACPLDAMLAATAPRTFSCDAARALGAVCAAREAAGRGSRTDCLDPDLVRGPGARRAAEKDLATQRDGSPERVSAREVSV